MHVRDTNDDGPTDTTRAHNTSTLVLVVRHRYTTLPQAGTHTHHATPPPRHTTDTRARTTQDPSDARMRGSHSPHLMSAFSSSSQSPAQTHAPSPAARARTHARTGTHTPTHDTTQPTECTHTHMYTYIHTHRQNFVMRTTRSGCRAQQPSRTQRSSTAARACSGSAPPAPRARQLKQLTRSLATACGPRWVRM